MSSTFLNYVMALPIYVAENLADAYTAFKTGDGPLDLAAVRTFLCYLCPDKGAGEVEEVALELMTLIDSNGNGNIEFAEFASFVEQRRAEIQKMTQLVQFYASDDTTVPRMPDTIVAPLFALYSGRTDVPTAPVEASKAAVGVALDEYFPDLPAYILDDLYPFLATHAAKGDGNTLSLASFVAVFGKAKSSNRRRASVARMAPVAPQEEPPEAEAPAAPRDPLAATNLTEPQLDALCAALVPGAVEQQPIAVAGASCAEIAASLVRFFDPKLLPTDTTLLDVAQAVTLTTTSDTAPRAVLGEFLQALNRRSSVANMAAQPPAAPGGVPVYTSKQLGAARRQDLVDALGEEELDMLRDAFVRLDGDGDGFIALADTVKAVSAVIGSRYPVFEPYLKAIFATADTDKDGKLDLAEFLRSFAEGPGVLPQEVVSECVAAVRIRLSDDEVILLSEAFTRMDLDGDGRLSAPEVKAALVEAMGPGFPDLTSDAYNDIVAIVIREADKDGDGALNFPEFLRSFHEDQGVLPVQLIELFSVAKKPAAPAALAAPTADPWQTSLPEEQEAPAPAGAVAATPRGEAEATPTAAEDNSLSPTANVEPVAPATEVKAQETRPAVTLDTLDDATLQQVQSALLALSADALIPEYSSVDKTTLRLRTAFEAQGIAPDVADDLAALVVASGHHRQADGTISVADFVRKHALKRRPSQAQNSPAREAPAAAAAAAPSDVAQCIVPKTSSITGDAVEVLDLSDTNGRTSQSGASIAADVFSVAAEQNLFQRIFQQFDTDADGFIGPADIQATQVRLLKLRHPDWTAATVARVAAAVFAAADDDNDGRLSFTEFFDSFAGAEAGSYGVLPSAYIKESAQRIALDMDAFKQIGVYLALSSADASAGGSFPSREQLSVALFTVLEKPLDSDMSSIGTVTELVQRNATPRTLPSGEQVLVITPFLDFLRDAFGHHALLAAAAATGTGPADDLLSPLTAEGPKLEPIQVALYDLRFILDVLRSLDQACVTSGSPGIHGKLAQALAPLYPDEASGVAQRVASNCAAGASAAYIRALRSGTKEATFFSAVLAAGPDPAATLFLTVLSEPERLAAANAAFAAIPPAAKRLVAQAFVECDALRNGELDFVGFTARLCSRVVQLAPAAREALAVALRGGGVQTSDHVMSVRSFAAPLVFAHYLMPQGPLPMLMTRRLNGSELLFVKRSVLTLRGTPPPKDHEEMRSRVLAALAAAPFADEGHNFQTVASGVANSFFAANLPIDRFCDMLDSDKVVLILPMLSLKDRREIAVRLLESGLPRSACRLLGRTILLLDTNRDGKVSVDQLQSAFAAAATGLVDLEVATKTVERVTLMVEPDTTYHGYVQIGEIVDQLLEAFPLPNVLEMTTVTATFPAPFKTGRDDAAVEAIRHALSMVPNTAWLSKEDLETLLVKESGVAEAQPWVSTIVTLFARISFDPETRLLAAGAIARASEVFHDSIAVGVNALPAACIPRAVAVALPAAQQRDLATAFLLADANHDNLLDFAEFSPVLSKLIKRPLKDALVFRNFASIDVDKDGYLELDEFLTAFANRKLNAHTTVTAILDLAEQRKRANNAAIAAKDGVVVPVAPSAVTPRKPRSAGHSPPRHTSHNAIPVAVCDDDLAEEFCKYDRDNTGLLSRKAFTTIYASLEHYGLPPSTEEIEKLLNRHCLAKPGFVTYQEFCIIMLRRSRM